MKENEMSDSCKVRAEALDAYLHGMLNDAQQRELNAHLLVCPQCNRTLSALEAETYLLGKGLRNVPAPAMTVSAADLVVRHAGRLSPNGTVELSEQEISELEKADRKARKAESGVIRLANHAAATTTQAVSFAHRRGLLKVAAIAFAAGLVIWFGVATAKKIDLLQVALNQLLGREVERESARLQHERDQAAQLELAIANLSESLQRKITRQQTLQQVENIERLNGLTKTLSDVEKGIENEISKYQAEIGKLTRTHEQQEQDRLNHEIESKALATQLDILRRNLNALREKADVDPVVAEVGDPHELRLVPESGIEIAFDRSVETMLPQPLNFKGNNIGWAMALGSARLGPALVVPGPGKMSERSLEFTGKSLNVHADPLRCAAPAVSNGKIYIGNGLAEGDMVAIDGATGRQLWCYAIRDTVGAPVVTDEGAVYFTTERGTIYGIADTKTRLGSQGNELFHKYLGPITTHAAYDEKCLFVVHKTEFKGKPAGELGYRYSLTCLKADTGAVLWTRGLNDDAISAPVACDGKVFVATRDGNMVVWDYNGKHILTKQVATTCAPVVSNGALYFSSWESHPRFGFNESLQKLAFDSRLTAKEQVAGPFKAAYFISSQQAQQPQASMTETSENDTAGEPGAAGEFNGLPVLHESWTYMGARPTIVDQSAYVSIGDKLICWDLKLNRAKWSCQISGSADTSGVGNVTGHGQPPLTPPAYASGRLYVGSVWGDVLCVDAQSGKQTWRYRFDDSKGITSQVMLDQGRAYATTGNGMLVCLDTGDQSVTGWHTFGGASGHNGVRAIK
jgi:outer membrane protein assembly factor BamB/anti-sigma factor RsiW